MRNPTSVMILLSGLLGCANNPPREPEQVNYGFRNGPRVWVRGPWNAITPSPDIDTVIDQLCPAVTTLPRATLRDYGQEYCGAIYPMDDGLYYASMPSPLSRTVLVGPAKRKACTPPSYVVDDRGPTIPVADFHSHPWSPSALSPIDALAKTQLWTIRVQFDSACHVEKLVPYKNENRPGEVFERQGRNWKLIGIIKPEDKEYGIITPVIAGTQETQ